MTLSTLDNVLWAAGLVGNAALLFILVLRGRWREYPVLTSDMAFQVLRTVLLVLVHEHGSRHAYFLAYWITGFADYVFQVALIFEIARVVLRPTGRWILDARRSFLLWGGAGCLAAAAFAMMIGPPQARGLDLWEVRTTVFTSLLTCELFIAVSAAANRLGLQRRNYVIAIGQGLTIWAFSSLLGDFGRVIYGWNTQFLVFSHVQMFVYLAVLGYWMVVFWRPEQARAPLSAEMNDYLLALHRRVEYDLSRIDGTSL